MGKINKKDPATDSIHLITVKGQDPSAWEDFLIHVYRGNGDIIARFSKEVRDDYVQAEVIDDAGKKKISIIMLSDYTKKLSKEVIYVKVFRQQTNGSYKMKLGPDMTNGKYALVELEEAEMWDIPIS